MGGVSIIVNVVARGASESERLSGDRAILENDIEKEEQKEQSDSERVRNAIDRLAPVGGEGLNIRV